LSEGKQWILRGATSGSSRISSFEFCIVGKAVGDGVWRRWRYVANWAGEVPDNFRRFLVGQAEFIFVVHFAEGAEDLGADVGEDRGTFGRDAVADNLNQELGQKCFYFRGVIEFGDVAEEFRRKITCIDFLIVETGVAEAEAGAGVQDGQAAVAVLLGAVAAMGSALGELGVEI